MKTGFCFMSYAKDVLTLRTMYYEMYVNVLECEATAFKSTGIICLLLEPFDKVFIIFFK